MSCIVHFLLCFQEESYKIIIILIIVIIKSHNLLLWARCFISQQHQWVHNLCQKVFQLTVVLVNREADSNPDSQTPSLTLLASLGCGSANLTLLCIFWVQNKFTICSYQRNRNYALEYMTLIDILYQT